jgi:hypothetical protein
MLSDSTKYYVCIPGKKAKGGNRMDLKLYSQFDITAYVDTTVGWARYGGGIGEVNQFRRCATA